MSVREDIAGIRVIKALSKMDYEKNKFDGVNQMVITCERNAEQTNGSAEPRNEHASESGSCRSDFGRGLQSKCGNV